MGDRQNPYRRGVSHHDFRSDADPLRFRHTCAEGYARDFRKNSETFQKNQKMAQLSQKSISRLQFFYYHPDGQTIDVEFERETLIQSAPNGQR